VTLPAAGAGVVDAAASLFSGEEVDMLPRVKQNPLTGPLISF
jgi:hypothetical protein